MLLYKAIREGEVKSLEPSPQRPVPVRFNHKFVFFWTIAVLDEHEGLPGGAASKVSAFAVSVLAAKLFSISSKFAFLTTIPKRGER
jgi:hypothetical protein